jgi:hypothetical protein
MEYRQPAFRTMRNMLAGIMMSAQTFPGAGSTGGTGPVSPSVLATQMCVVDAAGRGTLELLVLWRGSPGWFRKGGGASGSGSGGGGTMGAGPGPMVRTEWVSQGGVSLTVRFDPVARRAWIQDKDVALNDANVVLVDDVDSSAGPHVVRTLRIDPEYQTAPLRPMPAHMFIRRSPELVEFLQCDLPVPGLQPYEQKVFDTWCSWVKEP